MTEETNEGVEKKEEDVNTNSDSSTELDSLQKELEALRQENQQIKESNKKLVSNLRNKDNKRVLLAEQPKSPEQTKELADRIDRLETEIIKKREQAQKDSLNEFLDSETGKRYVNNGSPDNDGNFNKLNKAFDYLTKRDGIPETREEWKNLLKEADAIVRKDYGSLLDKQKDNSMEKKMAGIGGSTQKEKEGHENWSNYSEADIALMKRYNLKPSDIKH